MSPRPCLRPMPMENRAAELARVREDACRVTVVRARGTVMHCEFAGRRVAAALVGPLDALGWLVGIDDDGHAAHVPASLGMAESVRRGFAALLLRSVVSSVCAAVLP